MSSRLSPASSIACSAASTVSDNPVRPSLRPTTERPIPEMTASRSPIRSPKYRLVLILMM